ncbi:hypothetical protein CRUP_023727, partial [Coryphaenoides rupestris]
RRAERSDRREGRKSSASLVPATEPRNPGAASHRPDTRAPDSAKFYYITLLRDPVSRYLSEWRHVQRGATWKTSLHMCDGRTPTPEELPACYEGSDWSGCTLQQFMDCPYNLANNRQIQRIEELNDLDMELYDYARDLFQQRYQFTRQRERRQQRLRGRLPPGHQSLGLGVSLWPSRGGRPAGQALLGPDADGDGDEVGEGEGGVGVAGGRVGRTEEAGPNRLPTEDYMNQIIKRWLPILSVRFRTPGRRGNRLAARPSVGPVTFLDDVDFSK